MTIEFEFNTDYGVFRDAIVLPEDHTYTAAEIEAIKQTRLDNWLVAINPPSEG